jgi:hypothetical protein
LHSSIQSNLEFSLELPRYFLTLKAGTRTVSNLKYFNEYTIPVQAPEVVGMFYLRANKTFNFWYFASMFDVTLQKVTNDKYLRVPSSILYNSTFFQKNITFFTGGSLLLQTGFDTRINSKYYADAYKQSLGVYYLQNKKKYGEYPMIDFFVKTKIKEAGIFIKIENFMNLIQGRTAYYSPNYAYGNWLLRFGITWQFKY